MGGVAVIDEALAGFLESPVMIILGTHSDGAPEIARGLGAAVETGTGVLTILLSAWQWPATLANLRANGQIAATFSRPADYETYQVKGRVLAITEPGEAELALARRYSERIAQTLAGLGVEPEISAHWRVATDLVVLRILPERVFVQTPGPLAGQVRRG